MFLCTLSVLVSLAVANSSAHKQQLEAIESPETKNRYNVPQEIRSQVPVDFAALNLRKSRLRHQSDKNTWGNRPEVKRSPKIPNNGPKRTNAIKNTEIINGSTKIPMVTSQPLMSSEYMIDSSTNINKVINALPQEIVRIVRDEIDCNDDPTKNPKNVRGPPCTFSRRWPGTDEHSSLWMKNAFPQNWAAFTE